MKFISNAEREFIASIISKSKRLDGRNLDDGRAIKIHFRKDWSGCIAYLGKTIVLSQITATITKPRPAAPIEGILDVNFEISPMSAPDVNLSRFSDEFVELQRSLERCIRESKCLDLESLCIVANEKVWKISVDIRALNDDGNVLECGSIAAISALANFKRPDVTVVGTEAIVHPLDKRDPVPLIIHHMPIAVTIALFCKGTMGTRMVMDPTEVEERIADGCYIIGMNDQKEVCMIHRKGSFLISEDNIQKCIELAIHRAEIVIQTIRSALSKLNAKLYSQVPSTAV